MDRDRQKIILDRKFTIIQKEGPGDRRPFRDFACRRRFLKSRLKPVRAIRRSRAKVAGGVAVHRDESPTRLETPSNALAHRVQLIPVRGVVQQVRRHNQIVLPRKLQIAAIARQVFNPQRSFRFLSPRQSHHPVRQIDAGDACRSPVFQQPSVKSFATSDVKHIQPTDIADRFQQRETFQMRSPRRLFRPLVLFRNRIVVCRDGGASVPEPIAVSLMSSGVMNPALLRLKRCETVWRLNNASPLETSRI